jgi:nucleoside-diphosphate-sugar epimerase
MEICGITKKITSPETTRKKEIMDMRADITKTKKTLNWQPLYNLKSGLTHLVEQWQK